MSDADVIAAVRLAVEAGSTDRTKLLLAVEILQRADDSDPRATTPIRLLLDAIRAVDADVIVR